MPFVLAGVEYPTKVSVRAHIQAILNAHPLRHEFESVDLSDLVAGYHHYCAAHKLRPIRFRKIPYKRSYELKGYFPQQDIGWHDFSYLKCITNPTYFDEVYSFFRARVMPEMNRVRGLQCERCFASGDNGPLHIDHIEPQFVDMVRAAYSLFRQEEIDNWSYYDWIHSASFVLPEDHRVTKEFDFIHMLAETQTLCQSCHSQVTVDRRVTS